MIKKSALKASILIAKCIVDRFIYIRIIIWVIAKHKIPYGEGKKLSKLGPKTEKRQERASLTKHFPYIENI